jgi:hypothetical protein
MNYLKKSLTGFLIGIISLCLFSCEDDITEIPSVDRLNIQGSAITHEAKLMIHDGLQLNSDLSWLNSTGTSNAAGLLDYDLTMSHLSYQDEYSNLLFENGNFRITGRQGDYIMGSYHGGAQSRKYEEPVHLAFEITGGGGQYKDANGSINVDLIPDQIDQDQFTIRFAGVLRLPRKDISTD